MMSAVETYVIEGSLENGKETHADENDAYTRYNPYDVRVPGPGKDEEACHERKRTYHHGIQSCLRDRPAFIAVHGTDIGPLIQTVRAKPYYAPEEKSDERQRSNHRAPTTFFLENDGDR